MFIQLLAALPADGTTTGALENVESLDTPEPVIKGSGRQEIQSGDYRSRLLLIYSWATWCPSCLIVMACMQRLKGNSQAGPSASWP